MPWLHAHCMNSAGLYHIRRPARRFTSAELTQSQAVHLMSPRLNVFLADERIAGIDSGLRKEEFQPEDTLGAVLSILIEDAVYGDRLNGGSATFYRPVGLLCSPARNLLERANEWLSNNPSPLALEETIESLFRAPDRTQVQLLITIPSPAPTHRRPISLKPEIYSRPGLVSFIYKTALKQQFFFVQGSPASGKSTLCELLFNRICITEPFSFVSLFNIWQQRDTLQESLRASRIRSETLRLDTRSVVLDPPANGRIWLLFDEGQTSYEDTSFGAQ
ncbi:hypothetical protein C8R45DRAFT_461444 [Mycena sanguinolenta]|nr:hypothetical protein C8R45DRAFT_461444 [Mycena sanguinolenta]